MCDVLSLGKYERADGIDLREFGNDLKEENYLA